jgi:hypothetical protein
MAKTTALYRASEEARKNIEDRVQMYVSSSEVSQQNLQATSTELQKCQEQLSRYIEENREHKDKIKTKTEVNIISINIRLLCDPYTSICCGLIGHLCSSKGYS